MAYEELSKKYYITDDDMRTMWALRRKWAFDDVMNELQCGAYDDLDPMPTDEQIEDIITEYMEFMYFDRWESHLEIENAYMEEAFDRVLFRKER